MKFKPLVPFLLIVLLFNACKKSNTTKPDPEANITYPRTLYRTAITLKAGLRVFTRIGEITDPSIKNRILGDSTKIMGFPFNYSPPSNDTLLIKFIKADTALINNGKYKWNVNRSNGQLILMEEPIHYNIQGGSYLKTIDLGKYQQYIVDATGFTLMSAIVGYGDYTNLIVPTFNFYLKSGVYQSIGFSYSEFNEQAISKLGVNDTIAIKEYNFVMKAE